MRSRQRFIELLLLRNGCTEGYIKVFPDDQNAERDRGTKPSALLANHAGAASSSDLNPSQLPSYELHSG